MRKPVLTLCSQRMWHVMGSDLYVFFVSDHYGRRQFETRQITKALVSIATSQPSKQANGFFPEKTAVAGKQY